MRRVGCIRTGEKIMTCRIKTDLASRIEHTLLKAEATPAQIDKLCDEAIEHNFHGVCVNPIYVAQAAKRFTSAGGSGPVVVTVCGFPLGASSPEIKADEARRAIDDGATEIDMVAWIGGLVAGDEAGVQRDVEAVARAVCNAGEAYLLKAILETAALTDEQVELGCRICAEAGAEFVKTSTGFHAGGGATEHHVKLLAKASGLRVKAAGGIRDFATACRMIDAGASRIGTSSGIAIVS